MFRLAMSHFQAILTYFFDQTIIVNEMLARYGISITIVQPYGIP
jgi:hypothetical protein